MAAHRSHSPSQDSKTSETFLSDKHQPSHDNDQLHLVARHKCIQIARPQPLPCPYLAISDDEIQASIHKQEVDGLTAARARIVSSSLRIQMDSSVWDIIHKEVMDWQDSSWTSIHLPGNRACELILSSVHNARSSTADTDLEQ